MEKIVEQGRLYDFYGELLTDHQKRVYEAAVYEDLSLSEIAEREGISRQGVHDLLRRVTNTLKSYEDRLHMIARFDRISASLGELKQTVPADADRRIFGIIDRIEDDLQ